MEKYTMFMDWKNQYSENEYTTNSIFQRIRTNNFTICMEIQKDLKQTNNLKKGKRSWRNQVL